MCRFSLSFQNTRCSVQMTVEISSESDISAKVSMRDAQQASALSSHPQITIIDTQRPGCPFEWSYSPSGRSFAVGLIVPEGFDLPGEEGSEENGFGWMKRNVKRLRLAQDGRPERTWFLRRISGIFRCNEGTSESGQGVKDANEDEEFQPF